MIGKFGLVMKSFAIQIYRHLSINNKLSFSCSCIQLAPSHTCFQFVWPPRQDPRLHDFATGLFQPCRVLYAGVGAADQ